MATETEAKDGAGLVLGAYRLQEPVARGGMGEIWRAVEVESGRPVAIKRLLLQRGRELQAEHRVRLQREIQAFTGLSHENIVRCLGSGLDDEASPFLALEWLDGEDLARRQRRAPLDLEQVAEVARQALEGLGACHARGVVHRDIKPANLFLVGSGRASADAHAETVTDNQPLQLRLIDFGLAFFDDETSRLTQAGKILGTLYYLAPEQARGDADVDHRADLYALGVVLYELVTGKVPFRSDGAAAVLLKIVTEQPPRPRLLRPELPIWLEALILRAMQREPQGRFASAQQMREALEQGIAAGFDPGTAVELPDAAAAPGLVTTSLEYRLVTLLSVQVEAGVAPAEISGPIEEHGGTVHRLLGGQAVGLFGLDRTAGDEAFRAVRAGLSLRDKLGGRVRLLAASVHLVVGEGLQLDTKELDRATRSLRRLPPGELVVDEETKEQLGDPLELERVGQRLLVRALRVTHRAARRRVLGVETPTLGRETELAAVSAAFARAEENEEPEAVLVLGPPGIGKSRLCLEALPALHQRCGLLLEGRAAAHRAKTPFSLLADCVARAAKIHVGQPADERRGSLAALVAKHLPGQEGDDALPFIGEAAGIPFDEAPAVQVARADPKLMRERVAAAFELLLERAGRAAPVGLWLEDLHWADDESLLLLELLLERLDRTPLLLLGTARPQLSERHPTLFAVVDPVRLELAPLGRRTLRRLLRLVLGKDLSRELEVLIGDWSDGNPYFVEELVSWLVARRALTSGPGGWKLRSDPAELRLPAGIEAAVQGRLDPLPAELKELLKAASVQGEVFWEGACEAMGFSGAAAQLVQLEAAQFVVPRRDSRVAGTREWAFRHGLVHQVAGQMLPAEKRRPLHAALARWLEEKGEPDAALLAHHYEQGGDLRRAADHYATAGARALTDGDLKRAVDCFDLSLSGAPERLGEAQRAERTLGLARAYIYLGRYDRAWMVMDHLDLGGSADAGVRAEAAALQVLFLRGRILLGKGQYCEAEQALDQAATAASGADDGQLTFEVRHTLFWVFWVQGRYGAASPIAEDLTQRAQQSGRDDQLCQAKLASAYVNVVLGDLSASVALAGQAVEHARAFGHPYREVDSLTLLGSAQEFVGLYGEALSSLRAARDLAERLKTAHHRASVESLHARVHHCLGQLAPAISSYGAAIETSQSLSDFRTLIAALAGRARALSLPGATRELERARIDARKALSLAEDHAPPSEAEARLALVEVHLAAGETNEAVIHALAAVEVLDRLGTQERFEVEILLAAADALRAAQREVEADALRGRARDAVQRRADQISDAMVRKRFLGVTYNARTT